MLDGYQLETRTKLKLTGLDVWFGSVNMSIAKEIKTMNQRIEAVERWAHFVKNHPSEWKSMHTEFINSQFKKSEDFIERLLKQKGGTEKVIRLYEIKNTKGYSRLLNNKKQLTNPNI